MTEQHIVAGSAGFKEVGQGLLEVGPVVQYALDLTGKDDPRFCYVATAQGDKPERILPVLDACSKADVRASYLQLFPQPNRSNVEEFVLSQDVIWVGGGSVENLLGVWERHNLFAIFRQAWERGVILAGKSAGSLCWSAGGTTDSFGDDLRPVINKHALLPFSSGVHYDSEEQRRPLFHKLIADKTIPEGYATDDNVALHFAGTALVKAIADAPEKYAYYVHLDDAGTVAEEKIEPELLMDQRQKD